MIGQRQMLDKAALVEQEGARARFLRLFYKPAPWPGDAIYQRRPQDHGIDHVLDRQLIAGGR